MRGHIAFAKAGSMSTCRIFKTETLPWLFSDRDFCNSAIDQIEKFSNSFYRQPFVVAMHSGSILLTQDAADAIGLHAFGAQLCRIGCSREHDRKGDHAWKYCGLGLFQRLKKRRIETRWCYTWPDRS